LFQVALDDATTRHEVRGTTLDASEEANATRQFECRAHGPKRELLGFK